MPEILVLHPHSSKPRRGKILLFLLALIRRILGKVSDYTSAGHMFSLYQSWAQRDWRLGLSQSVSHVYPLIGIF